MPELPDVEGFRRVLSRCGAGRRIRAVRIPDAGVLRDVGADRLRGELEGRTLGTPRRHGKWLLSPLRSGRRHRAEEPTLVFHFGMTGLLVPVSQQEERHPHDRLVLVTPPGELRYRDLRKLQGISLAPNDSELSSLLDRLGPDAASVSEEEFRSRVLAKHGALKPALMNQSVVAGLGNLLVDEILWRARLHPSLRADELDRKALTTLHQTMRTVLHESVKQGRVPEDDRNWIIARRGAKGGPCPRCGSPLRRTRVSGKSTVICPRCQASGSS